MAVDQRSHYNVSQAAELLGVSRASVCRWIRDGRLPAAQLGHRTTRITREDLDRVLVQIGPAGSRSLNARSLDAAAKVACAPPAAWRAVGASEHIVQFYETDAFLLDAVAEFVGTTVRAGDVGIVIATEPHRTGLEERLWAYGLDVTAARADGRYVVLDAAETLARVMVDGVPDPDRFTEAVDGIVAEGATGGRRVRVFGEMTALLAGVGHHAAAIGLEELWNELQRTRSFALLCAYPMDRPGGEALTTVLGEVCAAHSRVVPAESYAALTTPDDRLRAVAVLQQKARWLEAEIAQRQRSEERLREALAAEQAARAATEAALRVRDEFLAIAAHELKTPVGGLSLQAQMLLRRFRRDGRLEPERIAPALEAIARQAAKLGFFIDRLLDVSRLDAGKLALERQPTDLAALVAQVVDGARALSERHLITLEAPPSLEAQVNPLRLEQVLANLLDNAVKYSPDGGPIDAVLCQPATGVVELAVRDRGLGIPPAQRDRIFERFYQAHGNGSTCGLGLGLYVSRQIVELHGGEIRAEFPADGGTRIVVRLPIGLGGPAAAQAAD